VPVPKVVDPVAMPVVPAVPLPKVEGPVVIELGHGLLKLLGGEMPIIGLTPVLLTSVEPSGMAPPSSLKLVPVPVVDNGEAVPVADTVEDAQPDIEVADPVVPPPSNVELVPVVDVELMPVVVGMAPLLPDVTDTGDPVDGHGLKPPGSISVAPMGMPVPLDAVEPSGRPVLDAVEPPEPGTPSGDVAPIPGVTIVLCASAMSQLSAIVSTRSKRCRIETSSTPAVPGISSWPAASCRRPLDVTQRSRLPSIAGHARLRRRAHQGDSTEAPGRAGRQADAARSDLLRRRSRRTWRDRNILRTEPANTARGQSRAGCDGFAQRGLRHGARRDSEEETESGDQWNGTICHDRSPFHFACADRCKRCGKTSRR
jgi:hypothetical protein